MMVSPFKFLDSYNKEDRDLFFGRDLEIEEVYTKVFQDKTLFVYGESGTGKSSLIHCGLANKFKDTDWLPVNVRRGNNINESLLHELDKLTLTKVSSLNGSFSKNLFKYTRSLYLDYFKPIYFIFDQFEELYLMGSREEWKEFISGIRTLAEKELQVHFIFIIRAEYLHFMTEFEEELPTIFNNKFRIERITRIRARECVEGPCKISGIKVEEGFSELLFDQLSPDKSEIELTYLQVYLDRIYKLAKKQQDQDQIVFSKNILHDIGMVGDVLSDFLDEQIESMPDKEATLLVLKSFVTIEGTKRQASVDDIMSFGKSLGKIIDIETVEIHILALLEKRILKELPDLGKYELRHDALAGKIFEKISIRERELIEVRQFLNYGLIEFQKRGFLLNEKDLTYIRPHLETLDLQEEVKKFVDESIRAVGKKRKLRKRVLGVIIIILLLAIMSLLAFFDAQRRRKEALDLKNLAEQNAQEAEDQKKNAEQNAALALISKQNAEESAGEALLQAQIAEQLRRIADTERLAAETSQEEAERQQLIAMLQKDSAVSARTQALLYLQEANRERERAERLSMQSLARSLGIKSTQLPDQEVKALLALQAYQFNQEFNGYTFQADIYNGLYQAYKQARGPDFNIFKKHASAVTSILNLGDQIITTGSDGKIILWSEDFKQAKVLNDTKMINITMELSPDQRKLVVGTSSSVLFVLDAVNGDILSRYQDHGGEILKVIFKNDQTIISSGENRIIRQWDLNSGGNNELSSLTNLAYAMAINKELNMLVIGTEDGWIYNLDLSSLETTKVLQRKGDMVTQLEFDHHFHHLAVGYESGTIQLLAPLSLEIIETLPGHTARVADIKYSKNDQFLISGGYDRKNFIWNLNRIKEPPVSLTDHDSFVMAVEFTPNGNEIICGELNGVIKRYQLNMRFYADQLCNILPRNLTEKEWLSFVPDNVPYRITCINKN